MMDVADRYILDGRNADNRNLATENRRLRARVTDLEHVMRKIVEDADGECVLDERDVVSLLRAALVPTHGDHA